MPAGLILDNGDSFGSSVACLGDVNGDGVVDLAVGALGDDDGAPDAGALYVIFLTTYGGASSFNKLSATSGMPAGFSLDEFDQFGNSVAGLGDVNGDGVVDLAVGADGDDDGANVDDSYAGALYFIYLTTFGGASSFNKLSATSGMPAGLILDNGDSFGSSVACLGDVNGDGVVDLAVGALGDDDGAPDAGALYVIFLTTYGGASSFNKLSATSGMPAGFSLDEFDQFGNSVAGLGDVNGDGVVDLAVGAFADGDGASDADGVYLRFFEIWLFKRPLTAALPQAIPAAYAASFTQPSPKSSPLPSVQERAASSAPGF